MAGEWKALRIGDLGRIVTGKTPLTKVKENFGEDLPFVTPSDMDSRKTINETERYLSNSGAGTVKNAILPAGAVIVSCIGSDMGKAAIAGSECVTNQQINSIIVSEEWCAEYVYYDLSTRKAELQNLASSGSAQPILNKGHFSQIPVVMPPLDEQRAIASILGSLDDKIELNRRMNETLEALARALFKSWFVDFDPVRAKMEGRQPAGMDDETAALFPDSFEDSPLGEIPKGWRTGVLEDLMVLQRGFDLPKKDRSSGPHPVMAASGPSGTHAEYKVEGPGVTTGRSGVLGKVFFVQDSYWPLNTSLWVKEFKKSRPLHAYHFLRTLNLQTFNAGSAVPTLNRNHVHNLPVIVPDAEIVREFEEIAKLSFLQLRANNKQSGTLAAIRDTLLPKLLSGEVRVGEAEEVVEDIV